MKIFALPWVKNQNFWAVQGRVMQRIKDEFDENGIEIPYPQSVIHVKGENQVIHKR